MLYRDIGDLGLKSILTKFCVCYKEDRVKEKESDVKVMSLVCSLNV